mmetsp:Transcript_12548/g.25561  ORF Transcript_12548/g.25561 Transcript_12548/m.25561 type:complete len:124 (+) Transcript_12548:404-775(+)
MILMIKKNNNFVFWGGKIKTKDFKKPSTFWMHISREDAFLSHQFNISINTVRAIGLWGCLFEPAFLCMTAAAYSAIRLDPHDVVSVWMRGRRELPTTAHSWDAFLRNLISFAGFYNRVGLLKG